MWYRVFAPTDTMPQPAALQERLRELGRDVALDVKGDDLGWTTIDAAGLRIERYLTEEDDLRDELDSWAAVVESWDSGPEATRLMQQVISTRQLFSLHAAAEPPERLDELARFLATATGGVYHADGRGFCSGDGRLLLPEPSIDRSQA